MFTPNNQLEKILAEMSHDKNLKTAIANARVKAEARLGIALQAKEHDRFVLGVATPEAAGQFNGLGLMHVCLSPGCHTVSIKHATLGPKLITA